MADHRHTNLHYDRPGPTVVTIRPNPTTPATTTTTTTVSPSFYVQLNLAYFTTLPGILLLLEILFAVICMACASPPVLSGTSWFLFVVVTSFIGTVLWIFVHLLSIRTITVQIVPWLAFEMWYTLIVGILYFTAFVVQLAVWSSVSGNQYRYYRDSNIAAGCFGLFNTLVFFVAAYLLYRQWKTDPVVPVIH